jgi:hypothetical protein
LLCVVLSKVGVKKSGLIDHRHSTCCISGLNRDIIII